MDIQPRYREPGGLTRHTKRAALDLAVVLPDGLAMLYWDREGHCRAFSLNHHNLHFRVDSLDGVYNHTSEIIPV